MAGYQRRIIDSVLDDLQPHLRALALFGPKSVGKTATALQRAKSVVDLSLKQQRQVIAADYGQLSSLPGPVLIDEWQRLPEVWDAVKRAVDTGTKPGHFIIAGSAIPRGAVVHSGAGRIVPMRMRPLAIAERGIELPTVSLAELLRGSNEISGRTNIGITDYVNEITASGFPGLRLLPPKVRTVELDAYIDNVVQREFPEQGYSVRRPEVLRSWLSAYAAATASTTTYSKILNASTPGEVNKPTKSTTLNYRDALDSLWLLDPIPGWLPTKNYLNRLSQSPKHMLADPALAARLLGLDSEALLRGEQGNTQRSEGTILGALFEHLTALSMWTYASIADARLNHLRNRNGTREIDIILTRPDGRVMAFEIKLANTVDDYDVRHLRWLKNEIGADLIDAAVITTGNEAYRRKDGIGVIPLALLGP